eukprot:Colp12_sorted_trinity150504_noHs@12230
MKPIMMYGHERSITQIKYNREGDLLFSTAKDQTPHVWRSENGERLGTYNGHNGAVWCIDVNWDTSKVLTGAADNTCILWDAQTGKDIHRFTTETAVRTCAFSTSNQSVLYSTDERMGRPSQVRVWDLNALDGSPRIVIDSPDSKVTSIMWGNLDKTIISGHEDGTIKEWDAVSGQRIRVIKEHEKSVNNIVPYLDRTMFITASKDHTAKLFDTADLTVLKVYRTEKPVNAAAISPIKDHVVLGGGQEAAQVTTTTTRAGKFDARFFHLVFEEEIGRVKGHFGPINSIAFHPSGKSYSSGGEDGFIRMHNFDNDYFSFEFEH